MKGIVISKPETFKFNEDLLEFSVRLPQPQRKKNVIHVLVRRDYEYIPEVDDVIEVSGNLVSFDLGSKEGVRLYVSTVVMYATSDPVKPADNTIKIRGVLGHISNLVTKSSGKTVLRFSVLPDNTTHNKIPVYCVLEGSAAETVAKWQAGITVVVLGRLITRRFNYKDTLRTTTEMHVEEIFNSAASKKEVIDE